MSNEVTVDRDLMERALKIIESAHVFSISDCEVEIRAALAATPSGPEKCGHCGRRTIDPPWTISPAAPQPAPAWHDAPDEREAFEAFINAPPYYDEETAWPIWQAACAWQKRKDEAICAGFSQEAYNRYRASRREYDDGQCDAANALADKIRSGE